ncbi:hypothetical protein N0V87_010132 [Didymella glomerata]|uniref:Uncharacterized protein n=1 Tax=Didymella glomerata TaxID=749621 RepID=A0A9W8WQW4_9PLEO|nr:hypothetical protein N0V87_010132 [Didymella glomerata]
MSLSGNNAPTDTRTTLARALGFTDYPKDTTAVPYLNYILKRHTGTESKEAYIELFVKIIEHFQSAAPANGTATDATVQSLVNELVQDGFGTFFAGTAAGDVRRKEIALDTVMLMLGTWATMYSSFQHKRQRRKVVAAYLIETLESVGAVSRSQGHPTILDIPVSVDIVLQTMQANYLRFATVVVFLTVVQVLLGIAQVVGSFK